MVSVVSSRSYIATADTKVPGTQAIRQVLCTTKHSVSEACTTASGVQHAIPERVAKLQNQCVEHNGSCETAFYLSREARAQRQVLMVHVSFFE
jgi:hypothetical protein